MLLVAGAAAPAAERARIGVRAEAVVAGEVVRLRDVAVLEGALAEALGDVALGASPAAGEVRTFDGRALLDRLRHAGLDPGRVTYAIPPGLRVRREAQEVAEAALHRVIQEFLADALGAGAGDAELRAVEVPAPVRLPVGSWRARVVAPPGVPLLGRTRLQVEFAVEDHPVRAVWVIADIGRFGQVVTLGRSLARGEVIGAGDLLVDRRDLSQVPRDVIADPLAAVGRMARVPMLAHAPVRSSEVEIVAAVRRGDVVMLVAEQGGMRITTPGEIREDARQGDAVKVVNRVSRKELVGRVIDSATVVVEF